MQRISVGLFNHPVKNIIVARREESIVEQFEEEFYEAAA
jgi:hypothetical protein